MKDIILSALILTLISAVVRTVLPRIKVLVKWIVKRFVKLAEKTVKGSHMGDKKKKRVLKWLFILNIKTNDFVDALIENTVEVMNNKSSDIKSEIQEDITSKIETGVDELTSKIRNN